MADSIRDLFTHWVASASRAPSAHNTQPARWHLDAGNAIHLIEDRRRLLPVADAGERDHQLSLGAACEGLALAASVDGYQLNQPDFKPGLDAQAFGPAYRTVATFTLGGHARADELVPFVERRAAYRGIFCSRDPELNRQARQAFDNAARYGFIEDSDVIEALAGLHDRCALDFARKDAYYRELYNWLRFNRRHPDWARDGLTAEALAMGKMEQWFGAAVAHPALFRVWCTLGLGAVFVGEAAKIRSAAFLLVLLEPQGIGRFDIGRRFYRTWLGITRLGLSACPMSALVDHEDGMAGLLRHISIPPGTTVVNVLRVGDAPAELPKQASRLPLEELILG